LTANQEPSEDHGEELEKGDREASERASHRDVTEGKMAIKVRHEVRQVRIRPQTVVIPPRRQGSLARPVVKKSTVGHAQLLLDEISGTYAADDFS
jgi:hypothetical protein